VGVAALQSHLTIVEITGWPEEPQKVGKAHPFHCLSTQSINIKAPRGQLNKNAMSFAMVFANLAILAVKNT
jgi:hypothetical protein